MSIRQEDCARPEARAKAGGGIGPAACAGAAALAVLTVYEFGKQFVFPHITIWQSHTMTILLGSALTACAAALLLRRQARLTAAARRRTEELQRLEGELGELRQTHGLILEAAGEGIYGVDLEGKTTFVNAAASAMLGWRPEELVGRAMHPVLHHTRPDGTPFPREECPVYAAFRDGQVRRVDDEVFWRKDGGSFPVEYVSTPIREGGRLTGAVVIFRDAAQRREAERRLREA